MGRSPLLLPLVPLLLAVALAGLLSCVPIDDSDVWWHLATGRLILAEGRVPHADPFTYTALGRPWVTHEWLSEVLFHLLERLGGIDLLVIFKAVLAALAVGLGAAAALAGHRSRQRLLAAAIGAALASPMIAVRSAVRPHMFTAVLLGVLLLLLRLESESGRRRWRVALPPLFLLWANLHAGFVLGLVLVALYWTGEAIAPRLRGAGSAAPPAWRERGVVLLLALIATLMNPNHIHAHLYALRLIARGEVRGSIVELRNVFHQAYHGALFVKVLAASGVALLALLVDARRRLHWALILPGLFLGAMAIGSIRGVSEFAVVLPALLGVHGGGLGAHRRSALAATAALVLAVVWTGVTAVGRGIPVGVDPNQKVGLGMERAGCPISAARLLKEIREEGDPEGSGGQGASRTGNVFNLLSYGGYLIHELGPETKVFIDGRLDVFPPGFLADYNRMLETGAGWDEAVKRYGIDLAVVNYVKDGDRGRGLRARLQQDRDWTCVLAGDYQLVYARRVPENQELLDRYGIPFDPSLRSRDFIGEFVSRASRSEVDQATKSLGKMAAIAPDEIAPSLFLGQILARTGRSTEALPHARQAARLDPANPQLRLFLAGVLQESDSLASARREIELLLAANPRDVEALSLLSLVERGEGKPQEALNALAKAAAIDPSNAVVEIRMGVIQAESGNLDEAERHLRRALALRPGDPAALQNLRALQALRTQQGTAGSAPR